jgi:50S ribosomal subunit-associated GTPase HflX
MKRHKGHQPRDLVAGTDVMLVGLFSGKDREVNAKLDLATARVEALGGRVVGRQVQRRGVSHGGVKRMGSPFSRTTLLNSGKVREVAEACRTHRVAAAIFVNPLTEQQRIALGDVFGCPVISSDDLIEGRD